MDANVAELLGKTIIQISKGSDEIAFRCSDDSGYKMHHRQSCCESVSIDDISGDLDDLIGSPITLAEEATSSDKKLDSENYQGESFLWTFYKFATLKGYVNIRWFGSSNGYYSESVDFEKIK